MHRAAFAFVASVADRRPPGLVLDIGGRNVNGSVRALFDGDRYLVLDRISGPGVDIVANGATYQPEAAPAAVVCCEVLEHTADAAAICRHALDILAPGGVLIVTTAGPDRAPHSAIDGGPLRPDEFYANVKPADLFRWLAGFADVQIHDAPETADVYAFARKADV